MRSGFVTVAGRPNVGKSTLINTIIGEKVTITSSRPNTTRHQIRGVLTKPDAQVIFVDTPGLHRPKTQLGERLNDAALSALDGVEVLVALIEASAAIGPGDTVVLTRSLAAAAMPGGPALLVALNKIDKAGPAKTAGQLSAALLKVEELAQGLGDRAIEAARAAEYFPVSARTGRGVDELVGAIVSRLSDGPAYYPDDMISDQGDAAHVAELVREQLLARTHDELPHSIHCQVTEWEGNAIRVEILVERDSQKAIVIGKGGAVLKEVGTAARAQLPPGTHLDLFVRVEKRWQMRPDVLDRFGY